MINKHSETLTLTKGQILEQFQISRMTFQRWLKGKWSDFPRPISGENTRRLLWSKEEVIEWLRVKSKQPQHKTVLSPAQQSEVQKTQSAENTLKMSSNVVSKD